ncbi:mycofactocin-coupled SDR family oxidoreductase [Sporichthya sp.]|uniref:mycofactocin-coupled SDR family oxidoreductase n=1 Tax=Sporichthya sp. TaxID=65475 RepID=UPI0017DDC6FA|nr:mycofactocin-coupled SDR family oxidoreductase [Sporichthya sp.]MBA3741798.1 mycofactocin-coupled SDR family oxidoreductase [Sporichthya sp.]
MSRLDGKVALITGAARGQGRSHALRLAADGADIVALDICADMPTVAYPLGTPADMAETVAGVEAADRNALAVTADVRDVEAMKSAVAEAVDRFGRLDIVIANAGIALPAWGVSDAQAFVDQIEVNLTGVWNTVHAAAPAMIDAGNGGSVVVISSVMGLSGRTGGGNGAADGYTAAKHGQVGLVRAWARWLAPHDIRVNSVHPSGVATPMVLNDAMAVLFADKPPPEKGSDVGNLLDVTILQPEDISNAVAWLVCDEARYVTGVALPVDAGFATP